MIGSKLVRLIEQHSDELARSLMLRLASSPRAAGLNRVPADEMQQRVYEVYHNLSTWLLNTTEEQIERRYSHIGMRRAEQDVPLSSVVYALMLTKEHLWDFLRHEGFGDRPVELFQELELALLVDQFYDRALYHIVRGYEKALTPHAV